jgi:ABC-type nitrate/sulfonate/bicarbonate transport systems, periplasmic components
MTRAKLIAALCTFALAAGAGSDGWSQETLKVAIPQRGAWDAGVAELGQRGGIFKKHGLDLEILYVQAGPESIQAVIGGSMDIATAPACPPPWVPSPRARRSASSAAK